MRAFHSAWLVFCLTALTVGCMPACAQDAAPAQDTFPVGDLHHVLGAAAEWWNLSGVGLEPSAGGVARMTGNGRILLSTKRAFTVQVGDLKAVIAPHSVAFVDQVGSQVRLMLLDGKATVTDGQRRFELSPSLQVVISPEPNTGYFINDGIYRRPVMKKLDASGRSTLVRQFYLEQVVYSDPILRTLYQTDAHARRMIERVNKTGAILRDLNGTGDYEQGQV